jgi:hypothetical protein
MMVMVVLAAAGKGNETLFFWSATAVERGRCLIILESVGREEKAYISTCSGSRGAASKNAKKNERPETTATKEGCIYLFASESASCKLLIIYTTGEQHIPRMWK